MPLCAFDETYLMMGVTPVENIFIMNYLPKAPGDFVRVYLFGLFQCYHPDSDMTPARMGRLLDLTEEEVTGAFQYWERMGIVKRVSDNPPAYHYLNIAMTWGDESPMEKAIYRHQDFNNRLQQLYGTRILHPAEYDLAAQWVEELGLPEEVVLILVESEIEKKSMPTYWKGRNIIHFAASKKHLGIYPGDKATAA